MHNKKKYCTKQIISIFDSKKTTNTSLVHNHIVHIKKKPPPRIQLKIQIWHCFPNWGPSCSVTLLAALQNNTTSESSSLLFKTASKSAAFSVSAHFSCQEQPGCTQTGSWWSPAATGWSWAQRWPCTFCHSCCTGWDSQCSPAASSSHCGRRIQRQKYLLEFRQITEHWLDVLNENICKHNLGLLVWSLQSENICSLTGFTV